MRRDTFHLRALFLLICVVCVSVRAGAAEDAVTVRWVNQDSVRVEVRGLDVAVLKASDEQSQKSLLKVFVAEPGPLADDGPPMAGTYRVDGGALVFEPRFPPQPGVTYRAVARSGGTAVVADFTPAVAAAKPTTLTQIYPTTDQVPENVLKFYLHFSAPMRRGHIYDHIRLLDEAGKPVELPFLEIDEELWDPSMTRLTLFLDPGRIKRGVQPLEEVGPALVAGKKFRLVIDAGWKDAAGNPLAKSFEKSFEVGPADREPPDHETWKVSPPAPASAAPLTIAFGEPMDHALAQRFIHVVDPDGKEVAGKPSLDDGERRWTFAPEKAWKSGKYSLVVQTTIEDLAGNNIGKPFEVDLAEGAKRVESRPTVRLAFNVADATAAAAPKAPMRLEWKDNYLTIRGEQMPGGAMKILYMEAYCRPGSTKRKWEQTTIGHTTRLVSSRDDGAALELECTLKDGVKVRHEIRAGGDEVEFNLTATNPTDKRSEAQWAQPCIRVDAFTGRDQKTYLGKCFIFLDGELGRMPTRGWATDALYTPGQVWYPKHVRGEDVNPRPVNAAVPDNGLIGCYSADEKTIFAVAFEPYQELFQGVIVCLHSDFRIGGLEPGETKTIRGKIYIVPADVKALLARYRKDFPEQEKGGY